MLFRVKGDDDQAFQDFDAAAGLGSTFARIEAAKVNPYAKMCNAMLSEVFKTYAQGKLPGPADAAASGGKIRTSPFAKSAMAPTP